MREILFRGKCKYNSLWICGSLISYNGKYFIIPTGVVYPEENGKYEFSFFEVIPETVGQWTGRCDNDECKIFDGDFLNKTDETIILVRYDDYYCEYSLYLCSRGDYCTYNFNTDEGELDLIDNVSFADYEHYVKAGNIHDNPELMEVE